MSEMMEWEDVEHGMSGYMYRTKVPGGWIYRHSEDVPVQEGGELRWGIAWQTSITFVPDMAPKWEGGPR